MSPPHQARSRRLNEARAGVKVWTPEGRRRVHGNDTLLLAVEPLTMIYILIIIELMFQTLYSIIDFLFIRFFSYCSDFLATKLRRLRL